jgi:hypothetical protein
MLVAVGARVDLLSKYGNPMLDRLDLDDGRRLLSLACQPVWTTTWMAEADGVISPATRPAGTARRRMVR